ncbi:MAG: 2-polyprenylphenol 6-hydroxylase [Mariprofundaceae bacterium]
MRLPLSLRRNIRLLAIVHILATHGMAAIAVRMRLFRPYVWLLNAFRSEDLPKDVGIQLRVALEKLGPTFIKFGQMLSTRVDILPIDVAIELKKLQDNVPPVPFSVVSTQLEQTYKRPILGENGMFSSFESEAIAAASIAQVHFAELHDGSKVAVKIRRSNIKKVIESDLAILRLLAAMFDRYLPEYRRLKAPRVIEEFSATILGELNLRAEAAHASRFAENLQEVQGVGIPKVVWDYTTTDVLVTERIIGIPIDERQLLAAAGHDPMQLCERLAALFFHMVFVDGYFHADLHPGNIFVTASGEIVLVDFGIVGRLDLKSRCYIADMLLAFLQQNYKRAAEVHLEAGYVPSNTNISAFEDAMREIAEPIFNRPLKDISLAELLFYLFAVTERFKMETQPELLLLQKTMVVIEGVARELEPEVNIWGLAKPLVATWVEKHLGPRVRVEQLANDVRKGLTSWLHLPDEIHRVLTEERITPYSRHHEKRPYIGGAILFLSSGGALLSAFSLQANPQPWYLIAGVITMFVGAWCLLRR